jgi:hypothetical protein
MDEALGTICSAISSDLLFHISSCKTPNEAWTTLEGIFGKKDEIRETHDGGGAAHIGSKNLRQYPRFLYKIQGFTVATQSLRG